MTFLLQILLSGITTGSIYALAALGFTMVFNVSRVLNLAQGAFLTYAPLLMFTLLQRGVPGWAAAVLGVAAAGLAGMLIDRIGLGRAYRQAGLAPLLVITLGISILAEGIAQNLWGTVPVRLPPVFGDVPLHLGRLTVATQSVVIMAALIAGATATAAFFGRTLLGKTMRAVADNRLAAGMIGVPVPRISALAFGLAGITGGVGGILLAPLTFASYDSGTLIALKGLVGAVLGGLHSPLGAMVGGLAVGIVEALGIGYVSSLFNHTTTFVVLILVLIARSFRWPPYLEALPTVHLRAPAARRPGVQSAALVGALALGLLPFVLADTYLVSLATLVGVFAIAVVGLDLLKGFAGVLSLGQGAFLGLAAYTSAILTLRYGWAPLPTLVVAAAANAGLAGLVAISSVRLEGYNMALATLACSIIAQDLLTGLADLTGGASGIAGIRAFAVGPFTFGIGRPMYYLVWAVAIGGALLARSLRASQAGRALVAIGQQESAAAAMGVPVKRLKVAAFMVAAVYASIAGSLYAHATSFVAPSLAGIGTSVALLTMLVVGGEGYVWGGFAGAAVIKLTPYVFGFLAGSDLLVEGLLLVVVMKYMPAGVWGSGVRAVDRVVAVIAARVRLTPLAEVDEHARAASSPGQ